MKLSELIEGATILQKYYTHDNYNVGAEHDEIHIYATDMPVTPEDFARLCVLGWSQPEAAGVEYEPEEGWHHFT